MGMTYRFYDAERVGALPGNYSIPWRGPAFLQEVGPKAQGFGNMTGGFMTGAQPPRHASALCCIMYGSFGIAGLYYLPLGGM